RLFRLYCAKMLFVGFQRSQVVLVYLYPQLRIRIEINGKLRYKGRKYGSHLKRYCHTPSPLDDTGQLEIVVNQYCISVETSMIQNEMPTIELIKDEGGCQRPIDPHFHIPISNCCGLNGFVDESQIRHV